MRILIITDQFPPRYFGGMAQHAWHMASHLGKNHEVEVLTVREDRDRTAEKSESFEVRAALTKRLPSHDFRIVAREARRFRADVVHVCTAGLLDDCLADEIPVVTRVVGNDFLRPWCGFNLPLRSVFYRLPGKRIKKAVNRCERRERKARVQRYLQASKIVVANSDWTRDRLLEVGVQAEQIRVIVGGMDDKLFTPSTDRSGLRKSLGWNVDDFVLVTAGNLIGKKNFDTVIRALAKLIDEGHGNMRYVAVGDGPDEEGLKRLTKQLKIADRVEFVGRKTQSALARYYQAADLYVQVSRNHLLESGGVDVETMGRTYFEAGGCGIPVIGARVGGVPSVIEDGKNGLLVEDPEDEEELVGKIEQVLSDSALRTNMADEGIKRATESLSWNAVGAKFEQILRSVRR